MAVDMDVEPARSAEFVTWYGQHRIPYLLRVPGWRRVRLFEQVEGRGPRFMSLHELESPAVFETSEFRDPAGAPGADIIGPAVTNRKRHLFKFRNRFPLPAWGMP